MIEIVSFKKNFEIFFKQIPIEIILTVQKERSLLESNELPQANWMIKFTQIIIVIIIFFNRNV